MGWVMFNGSAGTGVGNSPNVLTINLYNGTGTKWWARRSDGLARTWADATNILSTTQAPNWTPYQLVYQLAIPTVEPITSEGQFTFVEGDNQIEVGTGIVLHEYIIATKYRPKLSLVVPTIEASGGNLVPAQITISANGDVILFVEGNEWVTLSIIFKVD